MDIKILYGTETGNSESLANDAAKDFAANGINSEVLDMAKVSVNDLETYENALFITSTWGDGEPPSNAEDLYNSLKNSSESLSNLRYSVFAIGESFYERFCQVGIDFDQFLADHGASRILPLEKSDGDFADGFPLWLGKVKNSLKNLV
jgi:sulfite reductase (NADPH) flavoprotein alpha-component